MIPSIPGYGFSGPTNDTGWDSARVAKAWDTLMKRLGYERYGAHGGDAGALVTRELGILKPEGLVGVHVLQIFAFPSGDPEEMARMDEFEQAGMANLASFDEHSGYLKIQQTRPQTLAYALTDSPAGQLAWNSELFMGWDGENVGNVDRDRFLTHVSIFWFTTTAGSAARMYLEDAQVGRRLPRGAERDADRRVGVPERLPLRAGVRRALEQHRPLVAVGSRRALRRLGRAGPAGRGPPDVLPPVPVSPGSIVFQVGVRATGPPTSRT